MGYHLKELLKEHNTFDFVLYLLTFSATAIFIIDKLFQNESTIQEEKILRKESPFKPDWCSGKKEDTSKFAIYISSELKGQIFLC